MRLNCQIVTRRISSTSVVLASAAILAIAPAMAQTNPGGMPPTSPTQQGPPGAQPGASPMDRALNNNGQDPNGPAAMMDKAFVRKAMEGGWPKYNLDNSLPKKAAAKM